MTRPHLDRRSFLKAGSGLVAGVAVGGCTWTERSATPAPTTMAPIGDDLVTSTTAPTLPAPAGATRFRPSRPRRIVDTQLAGGWRRLDPTRFRITIADGAPVPTTATAAAVRVVGRAGPTGAGVTVVPAGADSTEPDGARPGPSGSTTRFVLLVDGALDVLHAPDVGSVTVDLLGWFEPVTTATGGGRVLPTPATTIVDTRATARPFEPGETRAIPCERACPVGASAVVVVVTADSERSDGRWTVHPPTSDDHPDTLVSSSDGPRSATTIVPVLDGAIAVTSELGGHVAVGVIGTVTDDAVPAELDGLFVPTPPLRLIDTRTVSQPIPVGSCREVAVGFEGCGAAAVEVTTVPTGDAASSDVWAAGRPRSTSSIVTRTPGGPAATSGLGVVTVGRRGVAVGNVEGEAHVVVDLCGWFVGSRPPDREPVCGSQPYGIQGIEMEALADEWLDYGISTEGRPLRAFRFGSGPRLGLISTGLHGDELTGTSVLADLVTRDVVPGWTLWLVPIANPDARAIERRYAHDVDMNRDFPAEWARIPSERPSGCVTTRTGPEPHSLVESRRLAEAMTVGPFRGAEISISHHDNYNWVAPQSGSPAGYRELADAYATATGLRLPGEGGSVVPTSPRSTRVPGGFETFAHSLGMASFLVENKAGYVGGSFCAGEFGVAPSPDDVAPHDAALRALLTDGRLDVG